MALSRGASIPSNWHRIVVAGQDRANLLSDAWKMVNLMEAKGDFRLVAVRKLVLPAKLALLNAMQNTSINVGSIIGIIAALHTGYHGFALYGLVNGDINSAREIAGFHPAFNFGNLSDSFVPRFVSRLIMIPAHLVDFILGGDKSTNFLVRKIRWTLMESYHDGVVWFALGTAAAALAGGAAHLLSDGYTDHNSLELFFEKI